MVATDILEDVIKPIEEYHLSKFNLSWRMLNQYLYHSRLYADRTIYNLITTFIEQVCLENIIFIILITLIILNYYTDFINSSIVCNDFKFDS